MQCGLLIGLFLQPSGIPPGGFPLDVWLCFPGYVVPGLSALTSGEKANPTAITAAMAKYLGNPFMH